MYSPLHVDLSPSKPFTDYSRWRLLVNDGGRHTWHYLNTDKELAQWPQNYVDKFWLGLETVRFSSSPYSTHANKYSFFLGPTRPSSCQRPLGRRTEWLQVL